MPGEHEKTLDDLMARLGGEELTARELEEIVGSLLQLPPGRVEWTSVVELIGRHEHLDFVDAYRRIAAEVPHTADSEMGYFYAAVADQLTRRGHGVLLPEVAAGFSRLDAASYDAGALGFLQEELLAAHEDELALELAERFLPFVRAELAADKLPQSMMDEQCELIFWLRCGRALTGAAGGQEPRELAVQLLAGIQEDEAHGGLVRHIAGEISQPSPHPPWTAEDLVLPRGSIHTDGTALNGSRRLHTTLISVAREAWGQNRVPAGGVLLGLARVVQAALEARQEQLDEGRSANDSLLAFLTAKGMEERIAESCTIVTGINRPRARMMAQACGILVGFARRHRLLPARQADASSLALLRISELLGD